MRLDARSRAPADQLRTRVAVLFAEPLVDLERIGSLLAGNLAGRLVFQLPVNDAVERVERAAFRRRNWLDGTVRVSVSHS